MNQNNQDTKPGISDPSKTTITQPASQPVQPAKMPDAAPSKDAGQPAQPSKDAVKTTP